MHRSTVVHWKAQCCNLKCNHLVSLFFFISRYYTVTFRPWTLKISTIDYNRRQREDLPAIGWGRDQVLIGDALSDTWKMRREGQRRSTKRSRLCCSSSEAPGSASRCTFIRRSCRGRCRCRATDMWCRGERKGTREGAVGFVVSWQKWQNYLHSVQK